MRGAGLACHLGWELDIPSVGCGKSLLVGKYSYLDVSAGSFAPLTLDKILVGWALRTRTKINPVFVSPGHKCGLDEARNLVFNCCSKYRLPEPIRFAHYYAAKIKEKLIHEQSK